MVWSGIDLGLSLRVIATGLIGAGVYWLTNRYINQRNRKG
jgi:hypothetical protein